MKVLVLTANPKDTARLQIKRQLKPIGEQGEAERAGSELQVKFRFDATLEDLRKGLDQHHPEVVHFAGHGDVSHRLIFDNGSGQGCPLDPAQVANLCELLADKTRVVLINACHSEAAAQELTSSGGVEFAIGWQGETYEGPAGTFAYAFYKSLDNCNPIPYAFKSAKASIVEFRDKVTPVLSSAIGADRKRRLCGRYTTARIRITPPHQLAGDDYKYGVMLVSEGIEGDGEFRLINQMRGLSASGSHRQLDVQYREHLGLQFKCCVEFPRAPRDMNEVASAFKTAGWGEPEQVPSRKKRIFFLLYDPQYRITKGPQYENNYIPYDPEIPASLGAGWYVEES